MNSESAMTRNPETGPDRNRIVLVTGPSGAGRATALNVLEDLGFETIDNIPLRMIPRLFDGAPLDHPLALGIDVRNRDFSLSALIDLHGGLSRSRDGGVALLYLDCRPDVLLRRYSETRRRHPLTPLDAPEAGILQEIALLGPIEQRADIVIDTSDLSPHDLKSELHQWFADGAGQSLSVTVQSFSYKRGIPNGADMVFDCRFLANPHWNDDLRDGTGLDGPVRAFVQADERYDGFAQRVRDLLLFMLPSIEAEGKTHFVVGIGCTGGQHRSVVMAQDVASTLAQQGWRVALNHKELARRGIAASGNSSAPEVGKAAK
ncbi:RNase adapter RapZ [Marivita sp. GX14005]|uniref:RNase adapter RapZ n=1 Tax=Marivita sp. GX14005 TaxID=2942276 RepID=UPI00201948B2|nr:RNase adapter RapZ [Marivita sp. GX14005]MCL3882123.1 RNase adapter RapZ [Marivita sp. GX14005]